MASEPRGAGRPPTHVDKAGKKILTAPISINIPIRMIDWIAEQKQKNPKFNVSRYMVDLIQKSMDGGMCPNCYGTNLQSVYPVRIAPLKECSQKAECSIRT